MIIPALRTVFAQEGGSMRVLLMAIVLILSSVAANAGRNTPHDPGKFTEYTTGLRFVLTADFTYTERRGIGIKIEQGLRAGTYEAKYQDEDGYYFVGPGPPIAGCRFGNPRGVSISGACVRL